MVVLGLTAAGAVSAAALPVRAVAPSARAALPVAVAAARPSDRTVAADPEVIHLDALGGTLLYTRRDADDQYRAVIARRGAARELAPQSSEDLEPRLGTDADGRPVASYRRCSADGKCGLFRLGLDDGRESPIGTGPPRGCRDAHPVVTGPRVVFARTCAGRGDGVYVLADHRRRRILALEGAAMGPLDADGTRVAAVAYRGGVSSLHVVGLGGARAFTLFRSSASAAGVNDRIDAPSLAAGRVTWGWIGEGEHVTVGLIFRARARSRSACTTEHRRFSTDPGEAGVSGELTGVAVDGARLLYGLAQTGVLEARSPAPAYTVGGVAATRMLGRGCDFRG